MEYCNQEKTWTKKCSLQPSETTWTPYEGYECGDCTTQKSHFRKLDQSWSMGNVVVEKYDQSFSTYSKLDNTWSMQRKYTLG